MERKPEGKARHAFLGTPAPGSVPPPIAPRPLDRMMQAGAPRMRHMPPAQTPSLQEAASDKDWLDWATTFG